jgi:hypothetical protein
MCLQKFKGACERRSTLAHFINACQRLAKL